MPASAHSWVCETQIFYVCVIVLLRFTQIFIRLKVLFIRGNYRVMLSCCIIHSMESVGEISLTSNSR